MFSAGFGEEEGATRSTTKLGPRGQGSPGVVGKGDAVHTILLTGALWHVPASLWQVQVREEESGPRAAIILSQLEFKPSGSSTGPATGLPTQSTMHNSSSYSCCCFPPRPPCPVVSYLMMPPPLWGVELSSLPGGSLSNLQASSIEATLMLPYQHRGPNWSCDMLCDEEENNSPQQK